MSSLKKLPVGIQTFKDIIDENYLYIDKTDIAYNLLNSYKYTFLSRPRRFGKSLFLDTLQNIFEGNKELFKGLDIYDKWDFDTTYPVIKISWDGKNRSSEDLEQSLKETLKNNQERLSVECEDDLDLTICFKRLITASYEKYNQKVVILIDEYDKPILDIVDDIEQAKEHREFIKGLYSIIKGNDAYIKFAFLTGVSKFSKSSIFSGLNMLEDISLNPEFGNICGYTQNDIETTFLPFLKDVDLQRFKNFYNGYNFLKDDIYNPFDTLLFIKNKFLYKNYWFETGSPTFLIKLIKDNNYFIPNLSNLTVDERLLDSFDIENLDLEVILYQSGYLTIDEMIEEDMGFASQIKYKLKIPNIEVKISLYNYILDTLLKENSQIKQKSQMSIYKALANNDLDALKEALLSLFASIPYNNYTRNNIAHFEGYYATVIYTYLASLGIKIIGEDVTNHGRIDLTLFIEDKIYIVEFKMKDNKTDPLAQIKEKNYAQKYISDKKDIYLVGIEFDEDEKNLCCFKYEQMILVNL
ncbi:MAG: ATP-binding protein [Campylobacterota bacterium]|nr:ATP-binding protein [Campylobacterota bacterium]